MTCLACCAGDQRSFVAREMMFGTREEFVYLECEVCGSLQIEPLPSDMGRFYPDDYYSFVLVGHRPGVGERVKNVVCYALLRPALRGLAERVLGARPYLPAHFAFRVGLLHGDRVLDVGSGAGELVDQLARLGFPRPTGVDPFIARDIAFPSGARVRKSSLGELNGEFDAIMFNHSLEHVEDPIASLKDAAARLSRRGRCIVRIPTSSSLAFERYRQDWVQLDPPRHIFVPSRAGMQKLGVRAGLRLVRTVDDSSAFQFWGSEQYKRDVPLQENGRIQPNGIEFNEPQLVEWEQQSQVLNAEHRGDQATFIFEKL